MGAGDRRVWINFIDTLQRDIRTPDEVSNIIFNDT